MCGISCCRSFLLSLRARANACLCSPHSNSTVTACHNCQAAGVCHAQNLPTSVVRWLSNINARYSLSYGVCIMGQAGRSRRHDCEAAEGFSSVPQRRSLRHVGEERASFFCEGLIVVRERLAYGRRLRPFVVHVAAQVLSQCRARAVRGLVVLVEFLIDYRL